MLTTVALLGGGMIAHDQLLPSLYHLQRQGVVGELHVVSQRSKTLISLASSPLLHEAFPEQDFYPHPTFTASDPGPHRHLYRDVLKELPPQSIVVIATPDHLHFEMVMTALAHDHHVICVKPLVLTAAEGRQIHQTAHERGLLVAVEYHKRFDDRSLMARRKYRDGLFGEFRLGAAVLHEKWYYRHSNFQNWCTTEHSDAFTYIGCHYVDLVHFITGLLPTGVSVYGIRDRYPNGNEGYLWTDARVLWDNGACLNVQNALGFPDEAPGTNTQGLTLYCAGADTGAWLQHSDQYRGLQYCYTRRPGGVAATVYAEPSPDYFQYVDLGGPGLVPVGYGYHSVEFLVKACLAVAQEPDTAARQLRIHEYEQAAVIATPGNSAYNELVVEAGRLSLANHGRMVHITYDPAPGLTVDCA